MDPLYDICFAGEVLEGHDPSTVRQNFARLFKADAATLEKLFSAKQTHILKRGCDRETALKYRKAIEQAGAKAVIRAHPQSEKKASVEKVEEKTAMTAAERIAKLAGAPDVVIEAPVVAPVETPPKTATNPGELQLAPLGAEVLRPEERSSPASAEIDTSTIDLMETGADLSAGSVDAPPAPDTGHLSMGEVGEDIPSLPSAAEPLSPDISGIDLSPDGFDFSDCTPAPAATPKLDLSDMVLAPSGADMLEKAYRREDSAEAPATEHLKLED